MELQDKIGTPWLACFWGKCQDYRVTTDVTDGAEDKAEMGGERLARRTAKYEAASRFFPLPRTSSLCWGPTGSRTQQPEPRSIRGRQESQELVRVGEE